jgi:hypothetical protein
MCVLWLLYILCFILHINVKDQNFSVNDNNSCILITCYLHNTVKCNCAYSRFCYIIHRGLCIARCFCG